MKKLIVIIVIALSIQSGNSQIPSYLPTNGLVGYWPFNGNANDESGNGNNGVINGASLSMDRFGSTNSAYEFNGISDFIEVNNSASLNLGTQDFSMTVWIKPNEFLNETQLIINKERTTAPDGNQLRLAIAKTDNQSDGHIYFFTQTGNNGLTFSSTNGYSLQTNSIAELNSWSFLTIVRTGIIFKLYLNGQLISSENSNTGVTIDYTTNYNNFIFGATSQATGNGKLAFFKGLIDDIGIWNRALTNQEITNLYNGNLNAICNIPQGTLTNGMVAYYPFCGNANDGSGNANNGTVNGATLTTDRYGNPNSAYSFDGVSNYIRVDNTLISNSPTSYTISAWYNTQNYSASNGDGRVLISDRNTGLCSYKYTMGFTTNHFINGVIYDCNGPNGDSVGGDAGLDNNWHNTVFIYDNSLATIFLYIDGVLVNTTTNVTKWSNMSNPTNIGYWNGFVGAGGFFEGKIDDIGIWNRALSQQEISNLYNINLSTNSFINSQSLITIYPNPTNSKISIDSNNQSDLIGSQIRIINTLGQEIYNSTLSQQIQEINLSSIASSGLYFVSIINKEGKLVASKKIILQ